MGTGLMVLQSLRQARPASGLDGVLIAGEDNRVLSFSESFGEIWGISPAVTATGDRAAILDEMSGLVAEAWDLTDAVQDVHEAHDRTWRRQVRLADGRFVDWQSSPMRDGASRPIGRAWFCREATERKAAESRAENQLRRLSALRAIDEAIASSLSLQGTLDVLLNHVVAELGVDAAAVLFVNRTSNELEYAAGLGFRTDVAHRRLAIGAGIAGAAVVERRRISVANFLEAEPRFTTSPLIALEGLVAVHAVPLVVKESVIGVLEVFHRQPLDPDPEWLAFLEALAGQAAIAIDNARLFDDLQHALERERQAVSAGNVGLWDRDLTSTSAYFSPEWKRQIGYADDEIADDIKEWESRLHLEDLDHCLNTVSEYLANPGPGYEVEFRLRHKNGSYRHILARGSVLRDAQGRPVRLLGSHVDVTERTELQAQFLQAQKMESVGRLAGGVAHDFNNLLSVIKLTAELAAMGVREGDPLRADLDQIRRAADGAAQLTRQLLAFSRKQVLQPVTLGLNKVIADMTGMIGRLIGEDIRLLFAPAEDLDDVKADPGQIEQVVMNLAVNARDAMPSGGTLSIATRNIELDEVYAEQHPSVEPGHYVMLSMTDSGVGMDAATRAKIFEPFFTTKALGKGTGLGLSTVYGIAKQSGGAVGVYSEVGQGTSFKIYLPRAEGGVDRGLPDRAPQVVGGTETILIVEDDAGVRRLAERVLKSAGYRVLSAANGGEALLLLEEQRTPVHLLLTDVVMPGIGGRELAERLRATRPDMRVLYASGYTDDAILHHGVLNDATYFVGKPYTLEGLTRKVREVLSQPI